MGKIVIATNNKNKLKEFREMLGGDVLSLADVGFTDDVEENGATFFENALIKAKAVGDFLKKHGVTAPALADDSGLCVEALDGAPGIYSARFAGEHGDDALNRKKLLDELAGVENRRAYFCCVTAEYFPDGTVFFGEGRTYGSITHEEIGNKGFGYDCLFFSDDINKTFGEAGDDEKNAVSHRGRALKDLLNKQK